MTDENTTTTEAPDALSVLGSLKARREQIIASATLDLPVARWTDPKVFVRYKPIDHAIIRRVQTAVEKAPKAEKAKVEVDGNCDVLIRACVGVFARIDGSDREYSLRPGDPEGELTTFDPDLCENLGVDATARSAVKGLYMFDGDIISAAGAVADFSGYKVTEADDSLRGE